jgi:hypothetical protein
MNIPGQDKQKAHRKALSFAICSFVTQFKTISRSSFFNSRKILPEFSTLLSTLLPNFNLAFSSEIAFDSGYQKACFQAESPLLPGRVSFVKV